MINKPNVVTVVQEDPEHGFTRGQVGTTVEILAPNVFKIDFSDDQGHPCAIVILSADTINASVVVYP